MSTAIQDALRQQIAALAQQESALIPIENETTPEDLRNAKEIFMQAYNLLGTTISQASEEGMQWIDIAEITGTARQSTTARFRGFHLRTNEPTYKEAVTYLTNR